MSKFYNVDMKGPFKMQRVSGLPSWVNKDEGRVIYDYVTQLMYFGDGNQWKAGGAYSDIPQNTIMLFEADTAEVGFSLLTNKDDMVIYITSGSGAGGAVAGTDQGTQTFPNHQHTQNTHQHTLGNHTHTFSGITSTEINQGPNNAYTAGGSDTHWHSYNDVTNAATGNTGSEGGDNTGNQSAPISWTSWKPKGRNITRQQRT